MNKNKWRIIHGLLVIIGLNVGVFYHYGWESMTKGILIVTFLALFLGFYPIISKKFKLPF